MALPEPTFSAPVDPLPGPFTKVCSQREKEGPKRLRELVTREIGGGDLGIVRLCEGRATSDHHGGAAWDWALNAAKPEDQARADALFSWLFAARDGVPNAYARRLGIRYLIWDRRIWSHARGWQPYNGKSFHREHVHISFSDEGARAETSWHTASHGKPPPRTGGAVSPAAVAVVVLLAVAAARR